MDCIGCCGVSLKVLIPFCITLLVVTVKSCKQSPYNNHASLLWLPCMCTQKVYKRLPINLSIHFYREWPGSNFCKHNGKPQMPSSVFLIRTQGPGVEWACWICRGDARESLYLGLAQNFKQLKENYFQCDSCFILSVIFRCFLFTWTKTYSNK